MKTAISVPDDIFRQGEALARQLGMSRSQLYSEALREYLWRHSSDAITEQLNRVYSEPETEEDRALAAFMHEAARQVLENTEW